MRWSCWSTEGTTAPVSPCATRRAGKQKSANVPEESVICGRFAASEKVVSQCGIGHTRWATHGGVNDCNAHPHQVGKVTLVHNGIIENYRELIADYDLADTLKSETDSEVVAALLNRFYEGKPEEAIKKTVSKLKGTFALVILFEDQKDVIYSTRNVSPIVATICKEGRDACQ